MQQTAIRWEQERKAADTEAKRKADETEQQRQANIGAEQERRAKADQKRQAEAEAEAKRIEQRLAALKTEEFNLKTGASLWLTNETIPDLNEAIQKNPKYAAGFLARALLYGRAGNLDRALADVNGALQIAPYYSLAFNARGAMYDIKGDSHGAIADYNEAIRYSNGLTNPYSAIIYCNRGNAKLKINDMSGKADIAKGKELDASACR